MGKEQGHGKGQVSERENGAGSRFAGVGLRSGGDALSWSHVSGDLIQEMIALCVSSGAAVTFGKTMDGSALGLTLYDNGERFKFWPGDAEEAEEVMRDVIRAAKAGKVS